MKKSGSQPDFFFIQHKPRLVKSQGLQGGLYEY